jgi:hypothetical protein
LNVSITGLPAFVILVGFVVVFSAPVWLAARVVGADNPTLWRAILSLFLGIVGMAMSLATGPWALLLAPLALLLSFKYVLGTSFLGAILLAIVAGAGYAALVHFVGGGVVPGHAVQSV